MSENKNLNQDTLNRFQAMTDKLMVIKHHPIDPVIEHSIDGIASEAGELVDAAKRVKWYGTDIDFTNILEECGDVLFYLDKLIRQCGSSFEKVMQMNMSKLAKRYNNFELTKEQAVNRDLDGERKILEGADQNCASCADTDCSSKPLPQRVCSGYVNNRNYPIDTVQQLVDSVRPQAEQVKACCGNCAERLLLKGCSRYIKTHSDGCCIDHKFMEYKGESK